MHIGQRIEKIMQNRGWNQKQLAEKVKINTSVLNRIIKGTRPVHHDELAVFSSILEVDSNFLIGKTDKPVPSNSNLPPLTAKDERDIAKKLEALINDLESDTSLAFDGEPMDEHTRELVLAQMESNLRLAKQLAKKKFTPKKYRDD
ncbi:hypothetical protein BKP35_18340 [Anaerobacillus arseniciselenatis]|uniref:HTH cro/C1-type domain-containing protein n=2 Tax=Anaerobacillus arseniciselenatis TaxID=85682 RepID=A0A1S2L5Q8_9BACI|nr:hypothetical protein BKP35_18340 [Anaerobacillus arseniciselenatis]